VQVLTVFAFSSENWNRPQEEVSGLMSLLANALAKEVAQLSRDGVRLYFVGDRRAERQGSGGPGRGRAHHRHNTRLVLNVCFNYGGRWDIAQAAQKLVAQGWS
jgi:undecaprenyl diphosphate synthase